MLIYIKQSKVFSVNGGPQKGWPPDRGVRSGLNPALGLGLEAKCSKSFMNFSFRKDKYHHFEYTLVTIIQ